jgi:hypothetical protein
VSTLPTGKVASTYDEAACTEAEKVQLRDELGDEPNCSEPVAVPAVLDCNDARVSLWLGEMIGSCDMPKTQLPGVLPVVRAPGSELRMCNDGRCGVDAVPLRPSARLFDDSTFALGNPGRPPILLTSTPLVDEIFLMRSQRDGNRLERPPRHA